jgi:small subunit ribosomal protein S6
MKFYEITYILHPALQEGRLNDIVQSVEKKIKSVGADILYSDNWGRKKLSYLIDKQKYGTYIFCQFKLEKVNHLAEISQEFEHNPNILRYLTIQIDEDGVKEKKSLNDSATISVKSDSKEEVKSDKEEVESDKEEVKSDKEEEILDEEKNEVIDKDKDKLKEDVSEDKEETEDNKEEE